MKSTLIKFPSPSSAEAIIAVSGLSRQFGTKKALNEVSIFVPRGSVLGFVGENGAGKTTLIKHLLGSLKAMTGSVRVFGLDPVLDPVRPAGMDARRRVYPLYAGLLSGLG